MLASSVCCSRSFFIAALAELLLCLFRFCPATRVPGEQRAAATVLPAATVDDTLALKEQALKAAQEVLFSVSRRAPMSGVGGLNGKKKLWEESR